MGKHARKRRRGWVLPVIITSVLASVLALAAGTAHVLNARSAPVSRQTPLPRFTSDPAFPEPPQTPSAPAKTIVTYAVRPGDTLTGIAREKCGHPGDWQELQRINHIGNPNAITAGKVITITC